MNRQLLPRQRTEPTPPARPGHAVPGPVAPPAAGRAGRGLRRPAVLALVAGATVVIAGLGWALVRTPGDVPTERASVLLRPRTAATPATPAPTVSSTPDSSGPAAAPGAVVRDPFGGEVAAPSSAPTTQLPPAPVVSGTSVPTGSPTAAGTTTAPTTSPTTVTSTSTVTRTVAPTVTTTVTATATAPGSAVYVGFYAWNRQRASFRVNARTWSVPVGTTFGPRLTFTAVVPGVPRCARVQYKGDSFTLCPGQVVRLP